MIRKRASESDETTTIGFFATLKVERTTQRTLHGTSSFWTGLMKWGMVLATVVAIGIMI